LGSESEAAPGSPPRYPFTAIVGQETAKTALIINAIDPTIGGALISGPKGSGKSLLVNALASILPGVEQVYSCPFHCSPVDPTNMCPDCLGRFEAGEEMPTSKSQMRVVQLPLSATEDRLVGSIDLDRAMDEGVRSLRPGLLAEANQNILYIDEVNLLPDHITDSILDAAASGWNTVEREGISYAHPSRFILIGTMNPEEGELRPQILDRFGLYAETHSIEDPGQRARLVALNEEYASDPTALISSHELGLKELGSRIEKAKKLLPEVEVSRDVCSVIAETCSRLRVDGFRPDIVAVKAAKALAAFQEATTITQEDVIFSLELALGHRTRRSGLEPPPSQAEIRKALRRSKRRGVLLGGEVSLDRLRGVIGLPRDVIEDLIRAATKSYLLSILIFIVFIASITYSIEYLRTMMIPTQPTSITVLLEIALGILLSVLVFRLTRVGKEEEGVVAAVDLSDLTIRTSRHLQLPDRKMQVGGGSTAGKVVYEQEVATPQNGLKILTSIGPTVGRRIDIKPMRRERSRSGAGHFRGRRARTVTSTSMGRYAWYRIPKEAPRDIALGPTLRAAATRRPKEGAGPCIEIKQEDLREKVREYRAPHSIVLLVDMSLSMIESVENVIKSVYELQRDVYRRRDRVGLIVFKGSKAFTIQHPTSNLDLVVKRLREVGASDFTPIAAGLYQAWKTLKQEKLRNREAVQSLVVVSDGITNVPLNTPLSPLTRRRYMSEAQADAFDVARLLAKEKIRVHVVNTKHSEGEAEASPVMYEGLRVKFSPTQFLIELARLAGGRYRGMALQDV
jgi:Mg-chelatase subunit ChlI/Mg-chelatase subunit ChlD